MFSSFKIFANESLSNKINELEFLKKTILNKIKKEISFASKLTLLMSLFYQIERKELPNVIGTLVWGRNDGEGVADHTHGRTDYVPQTMFS